MEPGLTPAILALLIGGGGLIGFLLAVLGAGGSILLLPLLVSGAALPTQQAVPLSLLMVTVLALVNLQPYVRRGQFAPRPALILGLPALTGSWIGGGWVKAGFVSEPVQLGVFAAAALLAAWLLNAGRRHPTPAGVGGRAMAWTLAGQGLLAGLLTGIAGVGGGFAIVPALVLLAGLPMPLASGTSLLLIAINALVAPPPWATGRPPACRCWPPAVRRGRGWFAGPAAGAAASGSAAAAGLCSPADQLCPADGRRGDEAASAERHHRHRHRHRQSHRHRLHQNTTHLNR